MEGIDRRAVFPSITGQALSYIVQYLQGRLPDLTDIAILYELLLVGEYLQLTSLQRLCSKFIAKQFYRFRSFGLLPDHLTRMILRELDTLHLCMAEQILTRDGRIASFNIASLWIRM